MNTTNKNCNLLSLPGRLLVASTVLLSANLWSAQAPAEISMEDFRSLLLVVAEKYPPQESHGLPGESALYRKILDASAAELEDFYSAIPDPDQFMRALEALDSLGNGLSETGVSHNGEYSWLQKTPAITVQSHPDADDIDPDYPSGTDYDSYVATLPGLNILKNGKQNRTDAHGVAGAWIALDTLEYVAINAQGVCDSAPSGDLNLGNSIACPLALVAWNAEKAARIVIQQASFQDSLIDGAEIEAAYENTVAIITQNNDQAADLAAHDTNIDADLAAHDTNIDADLAAHDTNIDADLAAHDSNIDNDLAAHDSHIDTDLALHDADVKSLMGGIQQTLDEQIELRKVHMQAVQIEQRKRYLITTKEAGKPISVIFESVEVFNDKTSAFESIAAADVNELEPGLYDLQLNLPPTSPDKVFRIRVRHDEPWDHFGEIIFHRTSVDSSN